MTEPLAPPPKRNPLVRMRVPVSPPGLRSRAAVGLAVAAAEGRFALQHCAECGAVQYPPRDLCRACLSDALIWRDTDPAGRIIAETTIRATPDAHFRDRLPVRIGTVQLDTGPVLICRLHGAVARPDRVRVTARIDAAGQAILLALPETEVPHMRDDPALRALSCDPRQRRILIADARQPEVPALARALREAGAAHVFAGEAEAWRPNPNRARLDGAEIVALDTTDADSVRELAAQIGGKVDILINNSRLTRPGHAMSRPDTVTATQEMQRGPMALLRLIQSFAPAMAARGADGTASAVAWVNLLPVGALVPQPDYALTCAAGAASLALSQGLRADLRGTGVRVIHLYAGALDDDWHQELPPPKLAPVALARALVGALIHGTEEVPAGDVARDLYDRWRADPAQAIREAQGGTL